MSFWRLTRVLGIQFLLSSHFPELPLRHADSPTAPQSLGRVGEGSRAQSLPSLGAQGLHWPRLSARGILGIVVFLFSIRTGRTRDRDSRDYDSQTPKHVAGHVVRKNAGLVGGACGAPQPFVTTGAGGPLWPPETLPWYARAPWGRTSPRPAWTSLGT